ncbi:PhzF family phenazine biosynthesis protein [Enterobacter mori]|uniref:PhzF family phenazine biosynthesis protein n=1 Tax=Enterobacter mori TaxID=539813 RepID=UPI00398B4968
MKNNLSKRHLIVPFFQVDAFSDGPFTGNPAAVCILDEWLEDETLLAIAKENNLSETAFVKKEDNGYSLRWFTPGIEVDLCGHATLAAASVIFEQYHFKGKVISFYTRSGELTVEKHEEFYVMNFPAVIPRNISIPEGLINAIGIQSDDVVEVLEASDIVVVLRDEQVLDTLNPDLATLKNFKTRGVVVTARSKEYDFRSRWFGPQVGVDEDPVTGSAHTFLGPYWSVKLDSRDLVAAQGGQRKGYLHCVIKDDERIELSGKARLVVEGIFHV